MSGDDTTRLFSPLNLRVDTLKRKQMSLPKVFDLRHCSNWTHQLLGKCTREKDLEIVDRDEIFKQKKKILISVTFYFLFIYNGRNLKII